MNSAGTASRASAWPASPPLTAAVDDGQLQTLLKRLFSQHCLFELRFANNEQAYQTAIIELVPEHEYFVLDELTPSDGGNHTQGQPQIFLKARLDGLDVKFTTCILQVGHENEVPYYKVPYPTSIEYPQRRREYRAIVPLAEGVTFEFTAADGHKLAGDVRDLSPSGFSARVGLGDPQQLVTSNLIQGRCGIAFVNGETVMATVEICHVYPSVGRTGARIGACFVDLDARAERALERYVAQLERARARLS